MTDDTSNHETTTDNIDQLTQSSTDQLTSRRAVLAGAAAVGAGALASTPVTGQEGDTEAVALDPTELHELLASARRRRILYVLFEESTGLDMKQLADRLAAREMPPIDTADARARLVTSLHHVHLPKLEAANFLTRTATDQLRLTRKADYFLPALRRDAVADGVDASTLP